MVIPEGFQPQAEEEQLLLGIINKLKASPQNSTIGLMMQWIGSPYQDDIKRIANDEHIVQQMSKLELNPAAEINGCLKDVEQSRIDSIQTALSNAGSLKEMNAEDKQALRLHLKNLAKLKGK